MTYGFFNDDYMEYNISQPKTPLPWINYLGTENYFGLISNTGGGYSFYRDARMRRISRYRYNSVPFDASGRYIYLRDREDGRIWSPGWQPTRTPLDSYSCRHGLGYSIIESSCGGIDSRVRYFVPLGEDLEIWQVRLSNSRDRAASLSLFSCIEFCLWDALDDFTNFQRNFNIGEVEVEDGVIYHKTEYRERRNHFAYFASSEPPVHYETQREFFLGAYRGWESPEAVESGQLTDSIAHGWAPIGSHQFDFLLEPGQVKTISFLLGYIENRQEEKFVDLTCQKINKGKAQIFVEKYRDHSNVESAFIDLRNYWQKLLGVFQVKTPDVHTNRMVNIWNPYQCMVTFNISRSASFFESGIGRGIGFRDSNQDLLGFVHMVPERARQRLLDLAATQLESGGAYHQYQPLTRRGNNAVGSGFNDDPLWLVIASAAYLKETGDLSILDESIPYDNQPGTETPFYEHLQRSIRYTLDRLGPHGLPLIGRADWNDCLNLNTFSEEPGESFQTSTHRDGKVAESIFIAGLFVLAAKDMAEISRYSGRIEESPAYEIYAEDMKNVVLEHGWDGEWFLRAYDHFGDKVGSRECAEGKIFIEPQGICVMAGIGLDDGKASKALDSVSDRLATKHGIVLQQPAFSHYYLNLGEISTYPPGYKENAGIFCHTNPWIMIAEALRGDGDRAYDYYMRINPSARESISDLHRCEPYVYAQMIAGKDAPTHGEAKNSWLTGTAAWNYVAISQWILGIRPSYEGLIVDPVVPSDWQGFQATRIFRGVTFEITVERASGEEEPGLYIAGKQLEGKVVPLPPSGLETIMVHVLLPQISRE